MMDGITVLGEKKAQRILAEAPSALSDAVEHWMWKERLRFIGNNSEDGAFRKSLMRKKRFRDGRGWSKGLVHGAFKGRIVRGGLPFDKNLILGVSKGNRERMPFLEALTSAHTVSPVNKSWLIIPFYRNLRAVGLFGRYGSWNYGKTKKHWGRLRNELSGTSSLDFVLYHGKLLVFGDIEKRGGGHRQRHLEQLNRKLLFVGVKQMRIRKKIDFIGSANRRSAGMKNRAETFLSRTIKKMEGGHIRG